MTAPLNEPTTPTWLAEAEPAIIRALDNEIERSALGLLTFSDVADIVARGLAELIEARETRVREMVRERIAEKTDEHSPNVRWGRRYDDAVGVALTTNQEPAYVSQEAAEAAARALHASRQGPYLPCGRSDCTEIRVALGGAA
jgi:hypothetical protein